MQKEIVQGIPFWRDKNNALYTFEVDKKDLIQIGKFDSEKQTYILNDNWKQVYSTKLSEYRTNLKNRERKENKIK